MNKTISISVGVLAAIAIAFFVGFLVGNNNNKEIPNKTERVISRIQGETVTQVISSPQPYAIHDTTIVEVPIPTDTAALYETWKDYYLTRSYNLDFSNDSLGTFKVLANVNRNRLVSAKSTIAPNITTITEKETIYKVKKIQIYTIVGTSVDFKTNQVQIGMDLGQKYLLGISGIRTEDEIGYTINAGIKF